MEAEQVEAERIAEEAQKQEEVWKIVKEAWKAEKAVALHQEAMRKTQEAAGGSGTIKVIRQPSAGPHGKLVIDDLACGNCVAK